MSSEVVLEQRLTAVEDSVAGLQHLQGVAPAPARWLDKVVGSVSDEPAFQEALEYGRAFRQADLPTVDAADCP